jgi:membrane-bound metal-dependent hydrolase YbcI (DUF457 family)
VNTPSHLIITAALRKRFTAKAPLPAAAVLWGSVAPDLPLTIMSIVGALYFRFVIGMTFDDALNLIFYDLFFNDPLWMAAHNVLQAPLILGASLALLWRYRFDEATPMRRWLFWFVAACSLHSLIDIVTHNDDGPLLLFPVNWQARFESPVSYWDTEHYGGIFFVFESVLNLVLLGYLLLPRARRWWLARQSQ